MANVATAIGYLQDHGNVNHVAHTEDGIIATAWERMAANCEAGTEYEGEDDSDDWFEVTEVFPVVNGMVDMGSIRNWLGY